MRKDAASFAVVGLLGILGLAGACGGKRASEPAWPRSAGRVEVDPEKDGGQSLEPQQASNVAAIERAEDRTPVVVEDAIVVEAPAPPKADATTEPKTDAKPDAKADAKPPTGQVEVIEIKPEDIGIDR
jgi:hypothetical protein